MPARGLSREEKRVKMMEIFHENGEFFTLKELEKVAPKQKQIVVQSVKEIVDELVGDGMVTMEKIGTSNYFWSFPSAAGATKQAILAKAQKELEDVQSKVEESKAALADAERGREDTAERRKLLSTLTALQAENKGLKTELEAFGAADPAKYERKTQAVEVCKEAATRWTASKSGADNVMVLFQYASNCGIEAEQLRAQLGISEDWDDLQM